MNCETCNAKIPTLATRTKRVNEALHKLGLTYYHALGTAVYDIDSVLVMNGFAAMEWDGTVYGTERRVHEEVGEGKYLTVSIHRMDSGRYEVVAYVN